MPQATDKPTSQKSSIESQPLNLGGRLQPWKALGVTENVRGGRHDVSDHVTVRGQKSLDLGGVHVAG